MLIYIDKFLNLITSFIPLFWNKYLTISIISLLLCIIYLSKFSKTCYNTNSTTSYECSSYEEYDPVNDEVIIHGGEEYVKFKGFFSGTKNIIITLITLSLLFMYIVSFFTNYSPEWIMRLNIIFIIIFIINYIYEGGCPNPESEVFFLCNYDRDSYYINWNSKIVWILLTISFLSFWWYWRKVSSGSMTIMGKYTSNDNIKIPGAPTQEMMDQFKKEIKKITGDNTDNSNVVKIAEKVINYQTNTVNLDNKVKELESKANKKVQELQINQNKTIKELETKYNNKLNQLRKRLNNVKEDIIEGNTTVTYNDENLKPCEKLVAQERLKAVKSINKVNKELQNGGDINEIIRNTYKY